jgi:HlyD family secretion protein
VVKDILVREGDHVLAGQVLLRMEGTEAVTDVQKLLRAKTRSELALQRFRAELDDSPFRPNDGAPQALADEAISLYQADREALGTRLAEETARLNKARQELAAAEQRKIAVAAVLPYYRKQEESLTRLATKGLSSQFKADETQRKRIEKEQELETEKHLIDSARAAIELSKKRLDSIRAKHALELRNQQEKVTERLEQLKLDIRKQQHRKSQLALRAPQDGVIKELATHTMGTVVQPGTILASLIPLRAPLQAEVWVSNADIGFVRPGQEVQLKLAAYPFQKYGMLEGRVTYISPVAQSALEARHAGLPAPMQSSLRYRTLVDIDTQSLNQDGHRYPLAAGMRTTAEIRLGTRTVAEYLLSPISKAWHEAGRER